MLGRAKTRFRSDPLEIELALGDELFGESETDELHVVEWGALGMLCK
jgi:hypothetical protein